MVALQLEAMRGLVLGPGRSEPALMVEAIGAAARAVCWRCAPPRCLKQLDPGL